MSRATEIYPLKRSIAKTLEKIQEDPHNAKILTKYYQARVAEGISDARIHKCLVTLKIISKTLGKSFKKATKDDIKKFGTELKTLQSQGIIEKLKTPVSRLVETLDFLAKDHFALENSDPGELIGQIRDKKLGIKKCADEIIQALQ